MKKFGKFLLKLITNNILLKLLALVLAAVTVLLINI